MNSEVRKELQRLQGIGWTVSDTGRGHPLVQHPEWGQVVFPATPSDHRWLQNSRAQVARAMGISKHELEVRLGVAQRKSDRPKSKRRRKRQRRSPLLVTDRNPPEPERPVETEVERARRRWEEAEQRAIQARLRGDLALPGGSGLPLARPGHRWIKCRECGEFFEHERKQGRPPVHCSPECKREEKNRRQRSDKPHCSLCGTRTRNPAPVETPRAGTVPVCTRCASTIRRRAENGGSPLVEGPWDG